MQVICIEFSCKIDIIVPAAAHRPDPFHILIILENSHQTGNTAFDRSFINNLRIRDTGLRQGSLNIIEHNRNCLRTPNGFRDKLTGQVAAHHSVVLFRKRCPGTCCADHDSHSRSCCQLFPHFLFHRVISCSGHGSFCYRLMCSCERISSCSRSISFASSSVI